MGFSHWFPPARRWRRERAGRVSKARRVAQYCCFIAYSTRESNRPTVL